MAHMRRKICVIGAGVIGLSSACRIQEQFQNCEITIIADTFSPYTTSDGAGALLGVYAVQDTPFHLIKKWASDTKDHVEILALSQESADAGVTILSGYMLGGDSDMKPMYTDLYHGYRNLTVKEMKLFPESSWGTFYTTFQIDCKLYLPWLMKRFIGGGGVILKKRINSLSELYGVYDVVVNCSGLKSAQLCQDKEITAARGETIRVKAPWIKHFYVRDTEDNMTYIIPGTHDVVLGGTFQAENWNENSNKEDRSSLWNRCVQVYPSLRNAEIKFHWVGLRPLRRNVRLELQRSPVKDCWIIHNYGHGGAGVTLHWGCAGDVVELVKEAIQTPLPNSKL